MNKKTQQTLALAGVVQAAFLVHQLSTNGVIAQDKLETSINSLFITNPKTTEEVFGTYRQLNLGFQVIRDVFQGKSIFFKTPEVMRYVLALFHVEAKLSNQQNMLDKIGSELNLMEVNFPEANYASSEIAMNQLANIYQNTISNLTFRIQVKGNMTFLKNEQTVHKIRATLLAGIRAAVLWRQLGGRRWHFLFYRKRIIDDVNILLRNISYH